MRSQRFRFVGRLITTILLVLLVNGQTGRAFFGFVPPSPGGDVTVTDLQGQPASIPQDSPAPSQANIRLSPATLYTFGVRIISVTGGTLQQADGSPITLGHTGTLLTSLDLRFTPAAGRATNASFQYVMVDTTSDTNSSESTATIPITLAKLPAPLVVTHAVGAYSDSVDLKATLSPAVAGQTVAFTVNGAAAGTSTTDGNGLATVTYSIQMGVGTYPVVATFGGDERCAAASGSETLSVTRETGTLTYTGDTAIPAGGGPIAVSATFAQSADGTPGDTSKIAQIQFHIVEVATGAVVETLLAPLEADGSARTTTSALTNAPHYVKTSLVTNSYFSVTVISPIAKVTPVVTVSSVSSKYDQQVTLQAAISGAHNPYGANVAFSVENGAAGSAVSNPEGLVSHGYTVNVPAGTYQISASYPGDQYNAAVTGTGTLTVTQQTADIAYTGDPVTPGLSGGPLNLRADLAYGGSPLVVPGGGKVRFRVKQLDGILADEQVADLSAAGTASATTVSLPNAPYNVYFSLEPNNYFTASPNAWRGVKATTGLTVSNANGQYSDTVTLQAQVTPPVEGLTVAFKVSGVLLGSGITGPGGVASYPYPINKGAGEQTVVAWLTAHANYAGSTGTGTLTVTQESAALTYTGATVTNGGPLTLSARVVEENDGGPGSIANAGSVQFAVKQAGDGTAVTTVTGAVTASGDAGATTAVLPDAPYTVEVSLPANSYYTAAALASAVQASTALTVENASGPEQGLVILRAVLNRAVAGKQVGFIVNGMGVGIGLTGADGVAKLTYTIASPVGSYTLGASFYGDALYQASSGSATLQVKPPPTLAIDGGAEWSRLAGTSQISGTSDAPDGTAVNVMIGTAIFETTLAGGSWSVQMTPGLVPGFYTVTATLADAAGNKVTPPRCSPCSP